MLSEYMLRSKVLVSILFPGSWIIFTVITLNLFWGRLPIFSSIICYYGFLPCSFICNIFFCCLISSNFLCLCSHFCRLWGLVLLASHVCPLVGEVSPGACVGFLVGRTGACVLVDEAESCPSNRQGHIKGCILGCLWT